MAQSLIVSTLDANVGLVDPDARSAVYPIIVDEETILVVLIEGPLDSVRALPRVIDPVEMPAPAGAASDRAWHRLCVFL